MFRNVSTHDVFIPIRCWLISVITGRCAKFSSGLCVLFRFVRWILMNLRKLNANRTMRSINQDKIRIFFYVDVIVHGYLSKNTFCVYKTSLTEKPSFHISIFAYTCEARWWQAANIDSLYTVFWMKIFKFSPFFVIFLFLSHIWWDILSIPIDSGVDLTYIQFRLSSLINSYSKLKLCNDYYQSSLTEGQISDWKKHTQGILQLEIVHPWARGGAISN